MNIVYFINGHICQHNDIYSKLIGASEYFS